MVLILGPTTNILYLSHIFVITKSCIYHNLLLLHTVGPGTLIEGYHFLYRIFSHTFDFHSCAGFLKYLIGFPIKHPHHPSYGFIYWKCALQFDIVCSFWYSGVSFLVAWHSSPFVFIFYFHLLGNYFSISTSVS